MMQRAIWRHEMRGGYGYVERVPAMLINVTDKRLRIRVQRRTGEIVERSVTPHRLTTPTPDEERCYAAIYVALASKAKER